MCEARRAPSAARTSGHQRRTWSAISVAETPDEHENQDRGDERAGQQPEQGAHAAGGERQVERERRLGEDQEKGEQEPLDDGARERVDRAGGDGGGRRQALPLEEADVDGHPRQVGGKGDVHVAHRQLHRVHRAQREPDGNRAQRRDRLRQPRQLCDDETTGDPRPGRVRHRGADLFPIDPARSVDDRVRRQHEQRHLHRGPLGDPPELDRARAARSRRPPRPALGSSSTSRLASFNCRRSEVLNAAACRYGTSSAMPSAPTASTATRRARSLPTRLAVLTSSCARSVVSWRASGARMASPRSTNPASRPTTTMVDGSIC